MRWRGSRRKPPAKIGAVPVGQTLKKTLVPPLVRLRRGRYFYNEHLFPRISRDEVYLVCHPRSGSNWLGCLVTSFVRGSPVTPELLSETVPAVLRGRLLPSWMEKTPATVLIRSHASYEDIPARVIYLMRDGRDAMLSYYWLRQKTEPPSNWVHSASPGEFFLKNGKYGPWHEHVLGWLEGLSTWAPDRYLIVKYENLVRDPIDQLGEIVEFLGFDPDRNRLERAVAWNTKDKLAKIDAESGDGAIHFPGLTKGHWSSALSAEEIARFEEMAGEALRRGGYPLASESPVDGALQ
jgi:estrone sulfotransferase